VEHLHVKFSIQKTLQQVTVLIFVIDYIENAVLWIMNDSCMVSISVF